MADQESTPLTDAERAELEELRAEKARREEAERARRERAELEELRAESRAAKADQAASASAPEPAPAAEAPRPKSAQGSAQRAKAEKPVVDPDNLTFGQRMVMTPDKTDDDGIPTMPPAQKIIIALGLICVIGGAIWIGLSNAGIV